MFEKWRKYSYADQRTENIKKLLILFWIGIFFAAYIVLTSFVIKINDLQNTSMMPSLYPGDRLVFLSFGVKEVFPEFPFINPLPLKRGDVVLVNMNGGEKPNFVLVFADTFCRFWTLGRMGVIQWDEKIFLKRVIALPGDEISMTNYVMRVKPAGDKYTYTEFELSKDLYTINIPEVPALWDKSIPFSGTMEPIVLGNGSYYLLSDERSNTNDSRTWGSVPARCIRGKAILRFWPFTRFGKI